MLGRLASVVSVSSRLLAAPANTTPAAYTTRLWSELILDVSMTGKAKPSATWEDGNTVAQAMITQRVVYFKNNVDGRLRFDLVGLFN